MNDLTCDFAQYYHILDVEQLPVTLAATLAAGLPADARCKSSGRSAEIVLLAAIYDLLAAVFTDKKHQRERKSMLETVLNAENEDKKTTGFSSGEEFEAVWKRILNQ
jgi:hypothetical protein